MCLVLSVSVLIRLAHARQLAAFYQLIETTKVLKETERDDVILAPIFGELMLRLCIGHFD